MKYWICFVFGVVLVNSISAKDIKYPVSGIPDSLKKNAFSVIRNYESTVDVLSQTQTRTEIWSAITVLNENGKRDAWESIHFDSDKTVSTVDVKMFNASGNEIEKWKKKDFDVVGYDSYGTAYSDSKAIIVKPVNNSYPYTIECHIVYEENNTYSIDGWSPVWGDNISVQKSKHTVKSEEFENIKYKEYNFGLNIEKTETSNSIAWKMSGYCALKDEPYQPSLRDIVPRVIVGAKMFQYGGYQGNSNTWKEFGEFRVKLNKGKDVLPEERKLEIDELTANCKSTKEKVNVLYKFMQSHTRYVNIAEGIGGIQPFSAQTVSENGYGDCKALSNYMLSILKHAGVKSYYAVVRAGAFSYHFDPEFVGHQSNHVILCVPLENDTMWLECTSQTMPCGFLGDFTDNRTVLLITEDGGKLAKTRTYTKQDNRIVRNVEVAIEGTGDCKANVSSEYTGLEYDDKHRLTVEDKEEQKKMLYKDFDIPNFKIKDFNLAISGEAFPQLKENVDLELTSYASKSGSRLFLSLNVASKWGYVPKKLSDRQFDIHKKYTCCYYDTVTFTLPENFTVEVLPEATSFENEFGKYETSIKIEDEKIVYVRYLDINAGEFPSEEYGDFREFFSKIVKADGAMAVLKQGGES